MIGEEVYHLSTGNNWVIGIITGTRDSGRSYDVLTEGGTSLRRNRSHLKPRSHDIPVLNQAFISGPHTSSQSEISGSSISGPAHPPKEKYTINTKYSLGTTHNNRFRTFQDISGTFEATEGDVGQCDLDLGSSHYIRADTGLHTHTHTHTHTHIETTTM